MIAVAPRVATLPPGELKEAARGDHTSGLMFLLLDTAQRGKLTMITLVGIPLITVVTKYYGGLFKVQCKPY